MTIRLLFTKKRVDDGKGKIMDTKFRCQMLEGFVGLRLKPPNKAVKINSAPDHTLKRPFHSIQKFYTLAMILELSGMCSVPSSVFRGLVHSDFLNLYVPK